MRTLLVSAFAFVLVSPPQERDLRAAVERLQKGIELLGGEEARRETDPGALAASLGHDLDKVFAFVRRLPFHPYRGVLRGARGTLLAGAGNDADRCLLLKDLLERAPAKPSVRFAFGELSGEQGAALAARSLRSVPGLHGASPGSLDDFLTRFGATQESVSAKKKAIARTVAPRAGRLLGSFEADRAALEAELKKAGIGLAGLESDGLGPYATALRSHVWLQVERGGAWVDLDPSFPEAAVGWPPMAPVRTADRLPGDLEHAVGIRLFVERLDGAALQRELVYSARRAAAELAGQAVNVSVLPMGFDVQKVSRPLPKLADGFQKFQPVVRWGGASENARVFDVQGRVFQSSGGKFGSDFGGAVGDRLLGGFGKKPTALAALEMELEVASPGEAPRVERRYLLDRLSPGTRESRKPAWDPRWQDERGFRLALFQSWTLWPATGTLNDGFLAGRIAGLLARDGGLPRVMLDLAEKKFEGKLTDVAGRTDDLPLGIVGFWHTALRWAQGAFRPGEGACFPDRPSLFVWKEALEPGAGDEVRWRGGVDLVFAPLGCVARSPADAARARFVYGLLLSEGESSMMQGGKAPVVSAPAVFQAAHRGKVPTVVLREKVAGVSLGDRSARLVREDLAAGNVVVLPRDPVEIGGRKVTAWWRVDPRSGACLGVGDTGEGQAVSEGVLILDNISIPMVQRCMTFVVCLNMAIASGRGMQDAGRECMMEFMEDYVKSTLENAIQTFVLDPIVEGTGSKPGLFRDDDAKGLTEHADDFIKDLYPDRPGAGGAGKMSYQDLYDLAKGHLDHAGEKASDLSGKVTLLLSMSQEIQEYVNEKRKETRGK